MKKKTGGATTRRVKSSKAGRSKSTTAKPSSTQALRIQAQIAMLKRALLAAEDDGLPHKAICDYLHTLGQMAKAETTGAVEASSIHVEARQTKISKRQLRKAIADIYGIAELPSSESATPPDARGATNESDK